MTKEGIRTSFAVKIDGENVEKWKKLSNKTGFVNTFVNNFLSGEAINLNGLLDENILNKFKADESRDLLIKKLITSYYNDNILFVDEYKKLLKISNTLNLSVPVEQSIVNINSKATDKKEVEEEVIYKENYTNNVLDEKYSSNKYEFNSEVCMDEEIANEEITNEEVVDEEVVDEDERTYVEDSKENKDKEEEKDEPLARKYNNSSRQRLFGKK